MVLISFLFKITLDSSFSIIEYCFFNLFITAVSDICILELLFIFAVSSCFISAKDLIGCFLRSFTICQPKRVLNGLEKSPSFSKEKAAISNGFTILPVPNLSSLPPLVLEPLSSEYSFANLTKVSLFWSLLYTSLILALLDLVLFEIKICAASISPLAALKLSTLSI